LKPVGQIRNRQKPRRTVAANSHAVKERMGKTTHIFCCGQYRDQSKQPALKQTKKKDNQTQTRLVQDVSHGQ